MVENRIEKIGTMIGHYTYDQKRTEAEAQQRYAYNYNQSKAPLVRIEDAFASSSTVRRGDAFDLYTTYAVLGSKGATMDVTETRELRYQTGDLTGPRSFIFENAAPGQKMPLPDGHPLPPPLTPKRLEKGSYMTTA